MMKRPVRVVSNIYRTFCCYNEEGSDDFVALAVFLFFIFFYVCVIYLIHFYKLCFCGPLFSYSLSLSLNSPC